MVHERRLEISFSMFPGGPTGGLKKKNNWAATQYPISIYTRFWVSNLYSFYWQGGKLKKEQSRTTHVVDQPERLLTERSSLRIRPNEQNKSCMYVFAKETRLHLLLQVLNFIWNYF